MTKYETGIMNVMVHEQSFEARGERTKEQHMADYLASLKALEEEMEPYKEQKRELKGNYVENGWLTKQDISLAVKAYRLAKSETDMSELIDMVQALRNQGVGQ